MYARTPLRRPARVLAASVATALTFGLAGCSESSDPLLDPASYEVDEKGHSTLAQDEFQAYAEKLAPLGAPEVGPMQYDPIFDDEVGEVEGLKVSYQEYVYPGVKRKKLEQALRDLGAAEEVGEAGCVDLDDVVGDEEWERTGRVEMCQYTQPFGPQTPAPMNATMAFLHRYDDGRSEAVVRFVYDPREEKG